MRVLIACEESQTVCKAFRAKGHEAYSCDLQEPSGGHPEWHILGDALLAVKGGQVTTLDGQTHNIDKWDLLIAHPPCTYLSKAGARWMFKLFDGEQFIRSSRYKQMISARKFFFAFLNADVARICVENPRPLKICELPEQTQIVQPYQYGHPYSKETLLWLKNLPPLKATNIVTDYTPFVPSNTGGLSRGKGGSRGIAHNAKDASKTFPGIAQAMAEQWGQIHNE